MFVNNLIMKKDQLFVLAIIAVISIVVSACA